MKKKYMVLYLLCIVLLGLLGCTADVSPDFPSPSPESTPPQSNSETVPPDVEDIHLMLFSKGDALPEEQETTEVFLAHWDLLTGEVRIDNAPLFVVNGNRYRYDTVLGWDGSQRILLTPKAELIEQRSELKFEVYSYKEEPAVFWADGYSFQVFENTLELTLDTGEKYFFDAQKELLTENGETIFLYGEPATLQYAGSCALAAKYEKSTLTLVSYHSDLQDPHMSKLMCTRLDVATGGITCSGLIEIPFEFVHGINRFPDASQTAIVGDTFYFAGEKTIGCLDLKKLEFYGWDEIYAELDKLHPNFKRYDGFGMKPITQVIGYTDEIVIGYADYVEQDDTMIHAVFFAVKKDELLGVCSIAGKFEPAVLTTYDSQLKPLQTVELSAEGLLYKNIGFEGHHYY